MIGWGIRAARSEGGNDFARRFETAPTHGRFPAMGRLVPPLTKPDPRVTVCRGCTRRTRLVSNQLQSWRVGRFKGGSIFLVGVTVEKTQYLSLEQDARRLMAVQ